MSTDIVTIADPLAVCRGCLTPYGEMKKMLEWGLADDFYKLTNIQVNKLDELSELLCRNCEDIITKNRNFVTQCRQSDSYLKRLKNQTTTKTKNNQQSTQNTMAFIIENDILCIDITAPNMEEKIYLPCPLCSESFQKRNDLSQHLNKKHKKNYKINQRFYCMEKCAYNKLSGKEKFFNGRKYLNQHIFKVHKEKLFLCSNCGLNFSNEAECKRHSNICNYIYICQVCNKEFKTNDRLLVHLLRKHPDLHKQYKSEKAEKRKKIMSCNSKKLKVDTEIDTCDSPKRSFATQTLLKNLKNDVTLSWQPEKFGTKKDEISTQTVFEHHPFSSIKSEEDSIFFSETVSLSDIQTQTIPIEFGLSRSNKETLTSETQSPDLSIKETQTCFCLSKSFKCDGFLSNFCTTSTETQTLDFRLDNDLLSFNSTETQTCFDDDINKSL